MIGIPYAALAYLLLSVALISARSGSARRKRVLTCLLLAPLWAALYVGPWFSSLENEVSKYESFWVFVLPSLLVAAAFFYWVGRNIKNDLRGEEPGGRSKLPASANAGD